MIKNTLICAAAMAFAGAAHAEPYIDYTLAGTVGSISDPNNVFGSAGGDPFSLTFYADFGEGSRSGGGGGFGGDNYLIGGYDPSAISGFSGYPVFSSPINAILTIDGHELYFPGLAASIAEATYNFFPGGEFSSLQLKAVDESSGTPGLSDTISTNLYSTDPTTFGDLEAPGAAVVDGTIVTGDASFSYQYVDPTTGQTITVNGSLDPLLETATVGSAPEPGAWAMMIVGLAGIGLALRQAKRQRGVCLRTGVARLI